MPSGSRALFYIAWVIRGKWADRIRLLQQYACDHFNTCKALRSPAHVTIVPPFWMEEEALPGALDTLEVWAREVPVFSWHIRRVNRFESRVIYVEVEGSKEVAAFRRKLFALLSDERAHAEYHPHITLAFRDLSPEAFAPAWRYFSQLPLSGTLSQEEVCILRHNGDTWDILRCFPHRHTSKGSESMTASHA